LAIDQTDGVSVETWWATLDVQALDEAVHALANRERCGEDRIGCIDLQSADALDPKDVALNVRKWAHRIGATSVVWTALPANFESRTGHAYSVERAMHHLDSLQGDARTTALEYIRRAPSTTATPLREEFAKRFDG